MSNANANNPAVADKRFTVTVDEGRHRRMKVEAARQGIKTRQLMELIIDYTMPLVEDGTLKTSEGAES